MKIKLLVFSIVLSTATFAQVGIGTNTPDASAMLEIKSTNKGFLPPRVALTASIHHHQLLHLLQDYCCSIQQQLVQHLMMFLLATIIGVEPLGINWLKITAPKQQHSSIEE